MPKGRTIRKLMGVGGGGRSTKNKGKLNEKKIHARQLIPPPPIPFLVVRP